MRSLYEIREEASRATLAMDTLMEELIETAKAEGHRLDRQPRVLDLSELKAYDGALYIERFTSDGTEYSETLDIALYGEEYDNVIKFITRDGGLWLASFRYGVSWRAWTHRPSALDMAEEPWEGLQWPWCAC